MRKLLWPKGLFRRKHDLADVFTPGAPSIAGFVPRGETSERIVNALTNRGVQLVIYGESGAGKSTLIINELARRRSAYIRTICTAASTYEDILLQAFDQLNQWVVSEKRSSKEARSAFGLSRQNRSTGIQAISETVRSSGETLEPLVRPQLNAQRLARALGEAQVTWVVDDFHKVPEAQKKPLAQAMRVFSDMSVDFPAVRMIVLGATDTAQEVIDLDLELKNHVTEIPVPRLDDVELRNLVRLGGGLLGLDFSNVEDEILRMSVGTASVTHGIARQCALARKVEKTTRPTQLVTGDDLAQAVRQYVLESEGTLRRSFDAGLRRDRIRRYDNPRLILEALASLPDDGAYHAEILSRIRQKEPDYGPGNLTNYSRQLMTDARGELLKQGLDGKFKFQSPLVHAYARTYFKLEALDGSRSIFEEALDGIAN